MGEEPVGMVRSFTHLIQKLDMKVGEGDDVRLRRIAAGFAPLRGDGPLFVFQIEFPPMSLQDLFYPLARNVNAVIVANESASAMTQNSYWPSVKGSWLLNLSL